MARAFLLGWVFFMTFMAALTLGSARSESFDLDCAVLWQFKGETHCDK